jgi:hypothetical protein
MSLITVFAEHLSWMVINNQTATEFLPQKLQHNKYYTSIKFQLHFLME